MFTIIELFNNGEEINHHGFNRFVGDQQKEQKEQVKIKHFKFTLHGNYFLLSESYYLPFVQSQKVSGKRILPQFLTPDKIAKKLGNSR